MRVNVIRYIRNCKVRGAQKISQTKKMGFMDSEKKINFPLQVIAVDIMEPFPRSNSRNRYLLITANWFTKYTLFALSEVITKKIVSITKKYVFLLFGVPQFITC